MEKIEGKTKARGITLIALVITIIVLLILAGISISMLSGDNSILNRATQSKQRTERVQIIETAQMDIIGKQIENHGSISEQELIEILTSSDYNTKGSLSDNGENSVLEKTLTSSDGKYEILVSDIYNGNLSQVSEKSKVDSINSKIGTVVDGYSPMGMEWQVYYADENETFLISKNIGSSAVELPNYGSSRENLNNPNYLDNWNSKWYSKLSTDALHASSLSTGRALYMCEAWDISSSDGGIANYIVNGPTIELLVASLNKSQNTNIVLLDSDFGGGGIDLAYHTYHDELFGYVSDKNLCGGIYSYNGDNHSGYYLATPSDDSGDGSMLAVWSDDGYGSIHGTYIGSGIVKADIRPLVSIATSKISVNGNTVSIIP